MRTLHLDPFWRTSIGFALGAIGKFAAPYLPEFAFQVSEFAVSFVLPKTQS